MFPDFLCIGAQKAGTTWLSRNLPYHPRIWTPPIKALRYFNEPSRTPLIFRAFSTHRRNERWRSLAKYRLYNLRNIHEEQHLRWFLRLFFFPRTDKWYASLFTPGPGQVAGEVTPAYARLDEAVVARIHSLMPGVKIIYLLRDPIERLWSQAAMHFSNRGYDNLLNVPEMELQAFLNRKNANLNSQYPEVLRRWETYFPSEQIFVGFFDKLREDPAGYLKDIYRFLGVEAEDRYIPPQVAQKHNARTYPPIPDHLARMLAERYYGDIESLHRRFENPYTARWLKRARNFLYSPSRL
ncbi:MAG: sulfotransferase [Calditrichaeota bacterium]|nr:MAG: sulfotransferase [Calditrichota bacterium]